MSPIRCPFPWIVLFAAHGIAFVAWVGLIEMSGLNPDVYVRLGHGLLHIGAAILIVHVATIAILGVIGLALAPERVFWRLLIAGAAIAFCCGFAWQGPLGGILFVAFAAFSLPLCVFVMMISVDPDDELHRFHDAPEKVISSDALAVLERKRNRSRAARRWQFTLRTAFVVTTICAVATFVSKEAIAWRDVRVPLIIWRGVRVPLIMLTLASAVPGMLYGLLTAPIQSLLSLDEAPIRRRKLFVGMASLVIPLSLVAIEIEEIPWAILQLGLLVGIQTVLLLSLLWLRLCGYRVIPRVWLRQESGLFVSAQYWTGRETPSTLPPEDFAEIANRDLSNE